MLGAACAAGRYRDVASHSSFESAGRELNSPSLTQQARNTWLWVVGRSQRRACIGIIPIVIFGSPSRAPGHMSIKWSDDH